MTYPMRISPCTSTIETAVYVNRTHGGVRGRELVTPSYSIEEELENEEIIAICRKNNITISDLMAKVNRQRVEMKKEKSNENQLEKE